MFYFQINSLEYIKFYDCDELQLIIPMDEFISDKALKRLIEENLEYHKIYDIVFQGKLETINKKGNEIKSVTVYMTISEFIEYFIND